jgi:hypothetical protein
MNGVKVQEMTKGSVIGQVVGSNHLDIGSMSKKPEEGSPNASQSVYSYFHKSKKPLSGLLFIPLQQVLLFSWFRVFAR